MHKRDRNMLTGYKITEKRLRGTTIKPIKGTTRMFAKSPYKETELKGQGTNVRLPMIAKKETIKKEMNHIFKRSVFELFCRPGSLKIFFVFEIP